MTNRHKALALADAAIERIENGGIVPDTQDTMAYAIVLLLADISEQLKEIDNTLMGIWSDGIGVEVPNTK